MSRGGKRSGSGRKPIDPSGEPRRQVWFMLTKAEEKHLRFALESVRKTKVKSDEEWTE